MELTLVGGKYKGRKLKFIPKIRPTSTKVRKAVFTILGERLDGKLFLDLFAGSGAMGIEALSRGARGVIFVERDKDAVKVIEKNLDSVDVGYLVSSRRFWDDMVAIYPWGVRRAIKFLGSLGVKVDVVYIDPPYGGRLERMTLKAICNYDILSPNAYVFVEHYNRHFFEFPQKLKLIKKREYGQTAVTEFRYGEDSFISG